MGKYTGRCVVIERLDGFHILDTVTKVESGIIPGGLEEARRGARNLENAREDSEKHSRPTWISRLTAKDLTGQVVL